MPEFKAGINAGKVLTAEVGELKRELSYMGDVMNTTARLLDMCREYQRDLLISTDIKLLLDTRAECGLRYNKIGDLTLRGKQQSITIYSAEIE